MSDRSSRGTLLNIPLIREKYGMSFLASIAIHAAIVLLILFGSYLLPRSVVRIGSGPGGGIGGETYTVGIADELAGGIGMTKPSLVPQPPALLDEKPAAPKPDAISLPQTLEPKKKPKWLQEKDANDAKKSPPHPESNVIPTAPQPGAGGTGGITGGSGGGRGGGNGVSIGFGSGGFGDSWYARTVEARISSYWNRPPAGVRVEMSYTFFIAADGTIYDIKQVKSSGNPAMDLTAEHAIRASNPLAPPPPEFRGRPVQFMAQFIFPQNQ